MSRHNDCFWSCGGTNCAAPEFPLTEDMRKDVAVEAIMDQPFF